MQVYAPEALVAAAQRLGLALATDFNEAVGLYHYVLDVWKLAAEEGVPCVLTTNGLFTEEALVELLPYSAAVRVDIKGWSEQALRAQRFWFDGMDVESPLRNLVFAGRYPVHREMTYCLIPTVNDDLSELEMLAKRLREEAGDVPVTMSNHYIANTTDTFPVATRDDVHRAAAVFSSYLSKVGTFVREYGHVSGCG
jgi:pyruvate formate lyase activating enzyme